MQTLTLQAPIPLHTYATRGGEISSDATGLIADVPSGTQLFSDLMANGCYVVPAAAPSTTDPLTTDPVE